MAEENKQQHQHGLSHHKDEEEKQMPVGEPVVLYSDSIFNPDGYSPDRYGGDGDIQSTDDVLNGDEPPQPADDHKDYAKEERGHKHHQERIAELGALASGAFALHAKHMANEDPEHAQGNKIGEGISTATAITIGEYAFHEHHEKKETKEEKN